MKDTTYDRMLKMILMNPGPVTGIQIRETIKMSSRQYFYSVRDIEKTGLVSVTKATTGRRCLIFTKNGEKYSEESVQRYLEFCAPDFEPPIISVRNDSAKTTIAYIQTGDKSDRTAPEANPSDFDQSSNVCNRTVSGVIQHSYVNSGGKKARKPAPDARLGTIAYIREEKTGDACRTAPDARLTTIAPIREDRENFQSSNGCNRRGPGANSGTYGWSQENGHDAGALVVTLKKGAPLKFSESDKSEKIVADKNRLPFKVGVDPDPVLEEVFQPTQDTGSGKRDFSIVSSRPKKAKPVPAEKKAKPIPANKKAKPASAEKAKPKTNSLPQPQNVGAKPSTLARSDADILLDDFRCPRTGKTLREIEAEKKSRKKSGNNPHPMDRPNAVDLRILQLLSPP